MIPSKKSIRQLKWINVKSNVRFTVTIFKVRHLGGVRGVMLVKRLQTIINEERSLLEKIYFYFLITIIVYGTKAGRNILLLRAGSDIVYLKNNN